MTILTRFAILLFFLFQLAVVFTNDQVNITTTQFTRNLINDNHTIELNQTNFNIAFRVVYVKQPRGKDPPFLVADIYRFFSIKVQQQVIDFEKVSNKAGFDP